MDSQRFNLTHGDITGKLLLVSVPIIGTQLMMMGYNLVDMFLLGRVGSDAVAASGSAGMYLWLSMGVMLIGRMGAEIGVSQCKGRGDREGARAYSQNALFLAMTLSVAFTLVCEFFPDAMISFLKIREPEVAQSACDYLRIVGLGIPASFIGASVAGSFTGAGNSRTPFLVNAFGLTMNAILDPIFIFSLDLGVKGAAIATVIAQVMACAVSMAFLLTKKDRPFKEYRFFVRPNMPRIRQILRWSVPMGMESMLFTFFSMVVARVVAFYGASAITVYRVGSQAESLSWLVALGFSAGVTTFVGQNFGAGKWSRIWTGFRISLTVLVSWGVLTTILFLTSGKWIIGIFIPEPHIIEMGASYLWYLAFCQVFFCLESIAAGAFRGMGKTTPPSISSILFNGLRIPTVYYLTSTDLGLDGIWLGVTVCASLRGIVTFLWFLRESRSRPSHDVDCAVSASARHKPDAGTVA